MDDKTKKLLNTKLRQPVHISYISKYILKEDLETTQKELDDLVEEGLIIESPLSSKYYAIKTISTQE